MKEILYEKNGEEINLTRELTKSLLLYSVYTDLSSGEVTRLCDYLQISPSVVKEIPGELMSCTKPKVLEKTYERIYKKYIIILCD